MAKRRPVRGTDLPRAFSKMGLSRSEVADLVGLSGGRLAALESSPRRIPGKIHAELFMALSGEYVRRRDAAGARYCSWAEEWQENVLNTAKAPGNIDKTPYEAHLQTCQQCREVLTWEDAHPFPMDILQPQPAGALEIVGRIAKVGAAAALLVGEGMLLDGWGAPLWLTEVVLVVSGVALTMLYIRLTRGQIAVWVAQDRT